MLSKDELRTLEKIAQGISHYQLLKVSVAASDDEIRDAFHREALILHPDRYQPSRDPEAIQLAKNIYSKLVDAYRVLSNRTKREEYDQSLQAVNGLVGASQQPSLSRAIINKMRGVDSDTPTNPGKDKLSGSSSNPSSGSTSSSSSQSGAPVEDENAITAIRRKPVGAATTAGLKFYKLAQTALNSRDLAAARMNIQIALNTDPKNPEFLQFAERLESELKRKK